MSFTIIQETVNAPDEKKSKCMCCLDGTGKQHCKTCKLILPTDPEMIKIFDLLGNNAAGHLFCTCPEKEEKKNNSTIECRYGMSCRDKENSNHCQKYSHAKKQCRHGSSCWYKNEESHTKLFYHP